MLSPKTQTNLKNAKGYFEEHLCAGDYYLEGEQVRGEWLGAGAARLGLRGEVAKDEFLALCENQNPISGGRLTPRQNSIRHDGLSAETANRRVFYDFVFSPPKSVSVAALAGEDTRIAPAHRAAVKIALSELEKFAATRVRGGSVHSDRLTNNIIAALFEHTTSRSLDPHLHTHCIIFNATHDHEERRWKALQNHEMLSAQKYVENVYYHELARALKGFGYKIVNSPRGDFEIAEVNRDICQRFSKRHQEIDEATRTFLAAHPEKNAGNRNKIREHMALKTRDQKQKEPDKIALREMWIQQLSQAEIRSLSLPNPVAKSDFQEHSPVVAVSWAEEHVFERNAVTREHELWRHALSFARGSDFTVAEIQSETALHDYVRENGKVADRNALAREWAMVEAAREGVGLHPPLVLNPDFDSQLDLDQRRATELILGSTDFMTLFRGGAGTGKSFVLKRIQGALDLSGTSSVVLAPQRQQSIDLDRDGLTGTQTVAECLQREGVPVGAVVIVDEAGQIGGRQLFDLIRMVQKRQGRLILSGDTRQHGPVEASDALRAIERYSGLRAAELNEIRRQDPNRGANRDEQRRIRSYREAVEAAAGGDLVHSLSKLEKLGSVLECSAADMGERIGEAYLKIRERNESAIVVSQTRAQVRTLNEGIRSKLRQNGFLAGNESEVVSLERVDLTAAQMRDSRHYAPDNVLVFNQDFRGCRRGQNGRLIGLTESGLVLEVEGKVRRVPFAQVGRLTVCRPNPLALCPGDKIQMKTNGVSLDGRKLSNGEVVTIANIDSAGTICLEDGRAVPATYRQFARGYAVTSYGSQGKTVDHVLLGDSGERGASNAQQWYVSISRGRKSIQIFTPDKEALGRAIKRSGDRGLALDLNGIPKHRARLENRILRGVKRGREFARRVCLLAMRSWYTGALRNKSDQARQIHSHAIHTRSQQTKRSADTHMLAP